MENEQIKPVGPDERVESTEPAAAGIGHNLGPVFDVEKRDALAKQAEKFTSVSSAWAKHVVRDEKDEALITDQITGLRKLKKIVDEARIADKKPYDDAAKAVQAAYVPIIRKIEASIEALKPKLAAYLTEKQRRIEDERRKAQEQAAREAAEAQRLAQQAEEQQDIARRVEAEEAMKAAEKAARQAAKPVKAQARSASGAGRTISTRTIREARITNIRALFLHYQDKREVADVLLRLANADIRNKDVDETKIPGIEIKTRTVAV